MRLHVLRDALHADLHSGSDRGKLVRSAGITATLKAGAALLAFGASLLYARVLGPHDYGLYAYVIAWVAVLTIPTGLGLPTYLVREGANAPRSLRWLSRRADRWIATSGLAVAALMAMAIFLPAAAGTRWLFVIAAPLPLLNSLSSVRRSLLQVRGWVARSQWPQLILGPTVILSALIVLWAWRGVLYPTELIAAMGGGALLTLFINESQLRRATSDAGDVRPTPIRLRAALPFMWLGGLYLINNRIDLIILGTLNGAHDAGVYAVAARASEFVTFFLMAAKVVIAPRIARLHKDGDHLLLQRLLSGATQRVLALSAPIALLFIVTARPLLAYLYGGNYSEGAIALQILAGAQIVNVAAGPTGMVLNMTGHENLSSLGMGLSVILNITLNAALIPLYGIEGAALATGISLTFWNILLWYWIRSRLGLHPTGIRL